jgi:1-acyl-sn-glycerol-3-phosphate acyltransferase
MQGYGGLKAILMCAIGCFPVDRKNGRTVLGPATDLLTNGEPLFICPEGRVDNTGTLGEFKPGAALIARAAYRKLQGKEKVGIVPIHICYHKRNVKTGDTWNFFKMGFTWRGGATVHVCEPVWINDNPQLGACEFMELVRSKIAQFSCTCSVSV